MHPKLSSWRLNYAQKSRIKFWQNSRVNSKILNLILTGKMCLHDQLYIYIYIYKYNYKLLVTRGITAVQKNNDNW